MSDFKDQKVTINTPFTQEKSVTQRGNMIHTIDGSMQLIHADVVDLIFFSKSVLAPKYCLVCADLFTSKAYTNTMKKKSHLPSKLKTFFFRDRKLKEIPEKRRKASHAPSDRSGI